MELKPNKLFFRRDGQIAGPFESHKGDKLQKSYQWLDINNGHWFNANGKIRYGKPEDRLDIVAEAPEAELTFTYRNWRGEIGVRRILPGRTVFKATEWHPEKQWLLEGFDLDKVEPRTFAMKDILHWGAKPPVRADMGNHVSGDLISQEAAVRAVNAGFDEWAAKPHNKKWVKRIDGTPIPNDVPVCIQTAIRALPAQGQPVAYRVFDMMMKPGSEMGEAIYPASRKIDAYEFAKLMRGECRPLYPLSAQGQPAAPAVKVKP